MEEIIVDKGKVIVRETVTNVTYEGDIESIDSELIIVDAEIERCNHMKSIAESKKEKLLVWRQRLVDELPA